MHNLAKNFQHLMKENREESRVAGMRAYMKEQFDFYGIYSKKRKILTNEFYQINKEHISSDLMPFIWSLWSLPQRELQYAAMDIYLRQKKQIIERDFHFIEKLILTKSWWDTVDFLASNIIAYYWKTYTNNKMKLIQQWVDSKNIWLIRSCIIHQLKYKNETDCLLLFSLIESQIGSKEFFINKAAGWALRQLSKINPHAVKEFIELHPNLNRITLAEARKYLS